MVHIVRCSGMTRRLVWRILKDDLHLERVYRLTAKEISHLYKVPIERAMQIHEDLHNPNLLEQIEIECKKYNIFTYFDSVYPHLLRKIKDPPLVLYAIGNLNLLGHQPAISVIGTRKPSEDGYKKTASIVDPLAKSGWPIVSGLARGIDYFAHERALVNQGKTIAVLGSGFEALYPKEHQTIAYKIVEQGLLLSEYPPNQTPRKHHFPERNRIISGLSFGTVVIEALERSGTMITVDQALDQGREVYALPGSSFIEQSRGCHELIRQGAKLVECGAEIEEDWETFGKMQLAQFVSQRTN